MKEIIQERNKKIKADFREWQDTGYRSDFILESLSKKYFLSPEYVRRIAQPFKHKSRREK